MKELIERLNELGINRLQEAVDNRRRFAIEFDREAELKRLEEIEKEIQL